ncbi:ribonuclease H-like domain-containing protein [Tanacetum coccineum]
MPRSNLLVLRSQQYYTFFMEAPAMSIQSTRTEAEYRGVANVVAETAWIRNLLCELHTPLFTATLVYCDNVSVVYMSANPVQHQRTKHIEIDSILLADFVASRQVRVLSCPLQGFSIGAPVANGRSQQQGIDCDETFSLAVKPATIRTVLSLAVSRQWHIHQLDVKNAFLHGHLKETIYMHQPSGFTYSAHSDYVCLLQKSLYGLKQAPRAWFQRFSSYVIQAGFYHSKTDSSLFIFHKGPDTAYLLLFVDDIILTASSTSLLQRIISLLHAEFAMTDLGPLNYFLGVSATHTTSGIFLSQTKYATEILEQAQMLNCNPCRTPIDTEKKLGPEGSPVTDPTLYRSLVGSLQYLTLSYAVQQLCLYMHDPREPHLNAMKRVLRYLRGTTDLGLQLFQSTTSQLIAYSDADWASCPATRRSTSGYCVFLGDNLLTWSSKRQDTLSRSSAEAEYRGFTNAVAETSWIRNLLRELHTHFLQRPWSTVIMESLAMEDVLVTLNYKGEFKKKEWRHKGRTVVTVICLRCNAYFREALVVVGNDEMVELVMDSGGSYHMTHMRDLFYDFKVFDGGLVQLGDNRTCTIKGTYTIKLYILEDVRYVPELRRSLISLGTLEKEGYTVKMQMGRIKVIKGFRVMMTRIRKKSCVYTLEAKVMTFGAQKQLGHKQVGFKQLGLSVKTGVHRVQDEKRFGLDGTVGSSRDPKEKVHLGIKVGANVTVTRILSQKGVEGNVAEKKKVKESMEANLGKLLKYNALSTRWSSIQGFGMLLAEH